MSKTDVFQKRHIGPNEDDLKVMLETCHASSLDELINETVPPHIRLEQELNLSDDALGEHEYLKNLRKIAAKNKVFKTYIGLGYYDCFTPTVIQRNIFENPGWYTQYTPYQAEISQGRLEALLNFQTMVLDLTGMEIANASLLDEGTAAAEAMGMAYRIKNKRHKGESRNKFFVSNECFQTTIDILQTRAEPIGIEIVIGDYQSTSFDEQYMGALLQYPTEDGKVHDYSSFIERAHASDVMVIFAADLLALALLKSPGELGVEVVVGSTQRFGVPLGFGGPHAAYFATKEELARDIPGRVIGVSVDSHNNTAYRMAIQTREQHIKRDKATSNICTAQALLAIMAGMYAVYHGPKGIKNIAQMVHRRAQALSNSLVQLGYQQSNQTYFDTIKVQFTADSPLTLQQVQQKAEDNQINFRQIDAQSLGISLDETTSLEDLGAIVSAFSEQPVSVQEYSGSYSFPNQLVRTSDYLTHPVFNRYRSETKMLRYLRRLEKKDLSLTASMIPLGSCTMKLNASTQMMPVSWPEFSKIHPFVPPSQTAGYIEIINELEKDLSEITGFAATSLQPNSGAQGEYTGLLVIRAYHIDRGDTERDIILIPASAHGTNPASAAMCGMKVVVVQCDEMGNIDTDDLKAKADKYSEKLAGLMITYPSTHGVYEEKIIEICQTIHDSGGQIYMDGANMNAQVGLTSPGRIGADVCHLNLHKTFAIPHGGGGPGMGPICVAKHLVPYLPKHSIIETGGSKAISPISSAPWGSASILLISYGYIKMLGKKGNLDSTKYAILNANYIKDRLADFYPLLYQGKNGRVAHEMIFDMRGFKKTTKIEVTDIAKRLMDYGFHAPTVSFPVAGTLMIEPTESEDKEELDRFCDAMIAIRKEIQEIEDGTASIDDNVLKNAPHTDVAVIQDKWDHPYSREKAVFPLPSLKENKFWPSVGRINESHGDRNLICSCPPLEDYINN